MPTKNSTSASAATPNVRFIRMSGYMLRITASSINTMGGAINPAI